MKGSILRLYLTYFIVMVNIMFTGMAFAQGEYFAAGVCGFLTYLTFRIAKKTRKLLNI